MLTTVTSIASALPPIVPGIGGAVLTGIQALAIASNFSMETNSQTRAQYSKFAQAKDENEDKNSMIGSRDGMTLIYLPAFAVSSALFVLPEVANLPFLPQQSLAEFFLMLHFGKRLLEVFYLHKYSGKVGRDLSIGIGFYYGLVSLLVCCVASPATGVGSDMIGAESALFAIGTAGNLYHHSILAGLRDSGKTDDKSYIAPKGGLFDFVAAPHYLFELMAWLGIAMVSQHLNAYLVFFSMTSYLSGRAYSQNEWNMSKFSDEEWPRSRKNIVPFLF